MKDMRGWYTREPKCCIGESNALNKIIYIVDEALEPKQGGRNTTKE